jgi:hypothetical protein
LVLGCRGFILLKYFFHLSYTSSTFKLEFHEGGISPSRLSSSFTSLLLPACFRLESGYVQSSVDLIHLAQLGFARSHFNFRVLHCVQDNMLSLDTRGSVVLGTVLSWASTDMWEFCRNLLRLSAFNVSKGIMGLGGIALP